MRNYIDILNDIYVSLKSNGLLYELKALKNEAQHHFTVTEIVGETYSVLLKMNQNPIVRNAIGHLTIEFGEFAECNRINVKPSEYFSLEQKVFKIDGIKFTTLKEFYDCIGNQLVENNNWGKNWNALNDILKGGFVNTEYGEPFILIWENSENSKSKMKDFDDIVELIMEHEHIDLKIK